MPRSSSRNDRPRSRVLTVREFIRSAKSVLESAFPEVRVRGEIVSFTRAASGHAYFTLADDDAQVRCVMYRTAARFLAFDPGEGVEVVAFGRASVYAPRGEMQLIVDAMEPVGAGALAAAFEKLKKELAGKGYFDAGRKSRSRSRRAMWAW
ncbi:MAG: exodeoxyribonuclease VII large subunit [Deltaproteobacteria bacterium]|nr:exodeoxyribonuclease VII large subunit [Deltaproteobacteria bacterium]